MESSGGTRRVAARLFLSSAMILSDFNELPFLMNDQMHDSRQEYQADQSRLENGKERALVNFRSLLLE